MERGGPGKKGTFIGFSKENLFTFGKIKAKTRTSKWDEVSTTKGSALTTFVRGKAKKGTRAPPRVTYTTNSVEIVFTTQVTRGKTGLGSEGN